MKDLINLIIILKKKISQYQIKNRNLKIIMTNFYFKENGINHIAEEYFKSKS